MMFINKGLVTSYQFPFIDRSRNLPFKLCQNKVCNYLALFAKEEKSKQNKGTNQKFLMRFIPIII